jgi:hypothetical protein
MAYGTVGKLHIKPDHTQDAIALLKEWERDRKPIARGAIASYTVQPDLDQNTLLVVAVFADQ